jgi:hypothetical protein
MGVSVGLFFFLFSEGNSPETPCLALLGGVHYSLRTETSLACKCSRITPLSAKPNKAREFA